MNKDLHATLMTIRCMAYASPAALGAWLVGIAYLSNEMIPIVVVSCAFIGMALVFGGLKLFGAYYMTIKEQSE